MNTSETIAVVTPMKKPRLTLFVLTLLSVVTALTLTCLFYKQAWQIPGLRELRDNCLVFALWLLASPVVGAALALTRRVTWGRAVRAWMFCVAAGLPAAAIGGGMHNLGTRSTDKAILCNLRQLAAAADQYFLENGTSTVFRYEDLVGPDKYVKSMRAMQGEDYSRNFPLHQGDPLSVELGHGRTISYDADPTADRSTSKKFAAKPAQVDSTTTLSMAGLAPVHTAERPLRRGTMCASCHNRR